MPNNLVSIVLPIYNGEQYLAQSIESVLNQTYKNLELIIVNDNSTDNSLKIAEDFAKKDARIRIINNYENQKLPESLNIGFRNAKGTYYSWTSDDNFYHPNAIEKMVENLDTQEQNTLVCCDFYKLNIETNEQELVKLQISPQNMIKENCVGACFMYRKSVALEIGEYNKEKFLVEDYDYWLRIMLKGNIAHIPTPLYTYRIHSNSLTANRMEEIIQNTELLKSEYLPLYKKKYKNIKTQARKEHVTLLEKIFSIKNRNSRKVVRILGIKISFKRKIKDNKINYLEKYKLAKQWIEKYTVDNKGIAVESNQPTTIYPECTGYYIPTLLKYGDKKRAINFGNYLISIQNQDGSWNEPSGKVPYTFDTGQILKGLVALVENNLDKNDKYKNSLLKGCDYILSMQREDGSIATVNYDWWGLPYGKSVPEYIHIYCLEPLRKTAQIYGIEKYEACVKKALDFYLSKTDLTDFTTLSHFNAYIIEGLIDLGETKRAQRAMDLISLHQRENGMVPAYSFVDFVCSTGLFQYAICWYKLGEIEKANRAFDYACSLQNKSGGFFGSYTVGKDEANYFPQGEIDWAVKYFLDAIYYREKLSYENCAHIFLDNIDNTDGRYLLIENELNNDKYKKILDLGCGKARYTQKLIKKYPDKEFHCVDLSKNVLEFVDCDVIKKEGSILNIPYNNKEFDFVFLTESLEHCIDLENAITEITRVLKPNGKVVIIDKNIKSLGQLQLADFEQWFDENKLCASFKHNKIKAKVVSNVKYENNKQDGLFSAWIGVKE